MKHVSGGFNENIVFAKRKFLLLITAAVFFILPKSVLAANPGDVVINEVMWMGTSASASDEWIELYNTTDEEINLSGWVLVAQDEVPTIDLLGIIPQKGYFLLERGDDSVISDVLTDQLYSGALENGGEHLFLKDSYEVKIDELDVSLGWSAGDNSSVENRASMEREGESWVTNDGITIMGKDANGKPINGTPTNSGLNPLPPTPIFTPTFSNTPMPTPTPIPTPTPAKATYQINEVKNKNGDILSSVKIYIDDQYIHHYAPEVLEFCDECYCDDNKEVGCGFGDHTIRLEKNGYQDWNEIKTINIGDSYTVDPIMIFLLVSTPTSTVVPTVSTATFSSSALAVSPSWPAPRFVLKAYSLVKNASPEPQVLGKQLSKQDKALPPLLFWSGGIFYIAFPIYRLRKRWYNDFNEKDFVLD